MGKVEVVQLGYKLMLEHGLVGKGWKFELDSAVRRFGCCNYTQRKISISSALAALNSVSEVTETILHEIAHALAYYKGELRHGAIWKSVAKSIGCTAERCYSSEVITPQVKKYRYECPHCKKTITKTYIMRTTRVACRDCCDKYANGYFDYRFKFRLIGEI